MAHRRLYADHTEFFGIDALATPLTEIEGGQLFAGEQNSEATMPNHCRRSHMDNFTQGAHEMRVFVL